MTSETLWEIPEPISVCEVRLHDGSVTTVRRHGNPSGLRLVLSHGNGLAIDLYYPFWSLLVDDFDLLVYDIRNHGWNAVGVQRNHNIPILMHDHDLVLEAVFDRYGDKTTVGVFHSISALISLLSFSRRFSAQVLFDPPLCKPTANEAEFDAAVERQAGLVRRRGHRFETEEEYADFLAYMRGFRRVVPGVRDLMARTTLRRSPDGDGFDLRCPREYEAQIVDYVRSFSPLFDLEELSCPTKVIGADPTLPSTYLPAFDLSKMLTVDYDWSLYRLLDRSGADRRSGQRRGAFGSRRAVPPRHGRRRPTIHEFLRRRKRKTNRGWSAFADHDGGSLGGFHARRDATASPAPIRARQPAVK